MPVSEATEAFLLAAAERNGVTPAELLDRLLRPAPLSSSGQADHLLGNLNRPAQDALDELDRQLRLATPNAQLVARQQFIGYRRVDSRLMPTAKSIRSHFFACLVPRRTLIRMVLPLHFPDFSHVAGARDLRTTGHHGVGDVAVDLTCPDEVVAVMEQFSDWLGPQR